MHQYVCLHGAFELASDYLLSLTQTLVCICQAFKVAAGDYLFYLLCINMCVCVTFELDVCVVFELATDCLVEPHSCSVV